MNDSFDEYSRVSRGGSVASRVDSQDTVSAVLAVELLGGLVQAVPADVPRNQLVISCEHLDDLEVRWPGGRHYVQVKDAVLDLRTIRGVIDHWIRIQRNTDPTARLSFALHGLRGSTTEVSSLVDDLGHLSAEQALPAELRNAGASASFSSRWGIPLEIATRLTVDLRDLRRDSRVCRAIFAHSVRTVFPVAGHTDDSLGQLLNRLSDEWFAPARRGRSSVSLDALYEWILVPLTPVQFLSFMTDAVRTPFGYLRDNVRLQQIRSEEAIVKAAHRAAMRAWRRATLLSRILALLFGPVKCPACNHGLMGNLVGREGVLCPQCKYFPYATLFYACDNRHPVPLVPQPDLSSPRLFGSVLELVRTERPQCPTCGSRVQPASLNSRLFVCLIPWPPPRRVDLALVSVRESVGHRARSPLDPATARGRMLEAFPSATEETDPFVQL